MSLLSVAGRCDNNTRLQAVKTNFLYQKLGCAGKNAHPLAVLLLVVDVDKVWRVVGGGGGNILVHIVVRGQSDILVVV